MSTKNMHVHRFEILMDAGFGAQKAGDILIRTFAKMGKFVFVEPMIPAEISPPPRTLASLSGANIRVGDFPLTNIGNSTDLIVASHEVVLERRLDDQEYSHNCVILLDMADKKLHEESYERVCKSLTKVNLTFYPFELTDTAKSTISSLAGKGKNMFYVGLLAAIYNIPKENVKDEIKIIFGKKLKEEILNKNFTLFEEGYDYAKANIDFDIRIEDKNAIQENNILIDGNTALSMGIIDAGYKLYSGYPITPASSIMHTLAKELPSYGGYVHQAEDEISAIGTAIGAYYGGVPSITATSGPGLSLKQEFIGYAQVAEIPLVVIDVQRGGPSTGMPTKTEQSDLPAVIFGSHGDHTKIVIGVGSIIDCFYAPHLARYLAEKLRLPIFIMSDFQIANNYKVLERPEPILMENAEDIPDFILERFRMKRLPDHIDMVRDLHDSPGTPGKMHRITGLNTDADGVVNYFPLSNLQSHELRNEKVHHVQRALEMPEMFGEIDEGDLLVMGWGSASGAIEEAVYSCQKQGLKVGGMCFRMVYPLPLTLKETFQKFKKIVTVELAYGDALKRTPLAMFLRSKTLADVTPMIAMATGRPITPKMIEERIKEAINEL